MYQALSRGEGTNGEPQADAVNTGAGVRARTVCLAVNIRTLGTRRTVSSDAVEVDADRSMIHVGKDIIESEELVSIRRLDSDMRRWLALRAVPSRITRSGCYLIPVGLIEVVDKYVAQYRAERTARIDAFVAAYPALVRQAEERLRSQFDALDYPPADAVARAFEVRASWLSFDVPAALRAISTELWSRERARVEAEWRDAAEEVRGALREGFAKLVDHLAERLQPAEDGKRKVFRDTAIANVTAFLDTFTARDVTDDSALAALVNQARGMLAGVDPDRVRSSSMTRERLAEGFGQIQASLSELVTPVARKVRFTDE